MQPGGRGLLPVPFLRTQLIRGPRLPGSGLSVSSWRDWRRSGRTRGSDGDGQGAPWETVGARLPLQAAPAPQPCGGPGGEKSQAAECDKAPKTLRRNWGEGLGESTTFENSTRSGAGAAGAAAHGDPHRTHAPGRSGILGLRFRLLCRPNGPLVSKALPRPSADWGRGLFFCFFFFF